MKGDTCSECGDEIVSSSDIPRHARLHHVGTAHILVPAPAQPKSTAVRKSKITAANAGVAWSRTEAERKRVRDQVMREEGRDIPTPGRITRVAQTKKIEAARKVKAAKAEGVLIVATVPEQITRTGIRKDDMTREEWLLLAVEKMRPDFEDVGRAVPPVRISIGWPGGRAARLDPLGQCWGPGAVGDGIQAIFITPSQDDPVQVLATTRHEMVHAAGEMHHRAGFRKLAAQVGFDPQPGASGVSSTYRTPALQAKLEALYSELGPFPHSPVAKGLTLSGAPRVQNTRMLKLICPEDEYSVRTTQKWIDVGLPSCPEGHEMEVAS